MFYLLNHKFQHEARKAVFSELSMQLEFCCEDLTLDTELSVFDEMTRAYCGTQDTGNKPPR
jgi:hypothetical protein